MSFTCPVCERKHPDYYREPSGLCAECHTFAVLPKNFPQRERYEQDGGRQRATRSPQTPFERRGPTTWQMLHQCRKGAKPG